MATSREKAEAIWDRMEGQLLVRPDRHDKEMWISIFATIIGDDWISVEDRLPDKHRDMLVTVNMENGTPFVGFDYYTGKRWKDFGDHVTAWRERPEPAK